jgi:hypothetical protein
MDALHPTSDQFSTQQQQQQQQQQSQQSISAPSKVKEYFFYASFTVLFSFCFSPLAFVFDLQ